MIYLSFNNKICLEEFSKSPTEIDKEYLPG
jgi:hypothetical protein